MKSISRILEGEGDETAPCGQVYTPPDLASLMAQALVEGLGRGGLSQAASGSSSPLLRVLDPACGAGALLEALTGRLPPGAERVGIELDVQALAEAQARLGPAGGSSHVRTQLLQGDALTLAAGWAGEFDGVVANPPYLAWSRIPRALRTALEQGCFLGAPLPCRPHHPDGQPDFSLAFLILAIHALKPMGRLVFLLPTEWLAAPRLKRLRTYLNQVLTLRALVVMPARCALFQSPSGGRIETNALLLVADRVTPPPDHTFPWMMLESREAMGGLEALLPGLLTGSAGDASLQGAGMQTATVVQSSLDPAGWEPLPQGMPPGLIPLGSLSGVRIFGGHQPVVSWLDWLTFTEAERAAVPLSERDVLFPAIRESREIGWPQVAPSHRYWCLFPPGLSEEVLRGRYPQLLLALRRKREQLQPGVRFEPGWWQFPNPRNRRLAIEAGPQLLFPRTAPQLQASWDPSGHTFKGTNTALRVLKPTQLPDGRLLDPTSMLLALFAYLNSAVGRRLARPFMRSYHQVAIRLEPTDVRRIPVPDPLQRPSWHAWSRISVASETILCSSGDFGRVEEAVQALISLH